MSKLLYLRKDDEVCYDLEYWEEYKKWNKLKELELIEMKPDKDTYMKWCTFYQEPLEGGECGKKECSEYIPTNGKRGKCVHKDFIYAENGSKVVI